MANFALFLFRIAYTIVMALIISKLIRGVVWPMLKKMWRKLKTISITWK